MNQAVRRILIIGGGFSGMSAAIQLRKQGVEVDLVEIDPGWRSYGAGISLGGATLRAFRTLGHPRRVPGAWQRHRRRGAVPSARTEDRRVADAAHRGARCPGRRRDHAAGAGAHPRRRDAGQRNQRASGLQLQLASNRMPKASRSASPTAGAQRYDLVIGADGLYSKVRETVFPDAPKPRYSGQAVWRAVLPTPPEIKTATMWMGPKIKPGVNPVSKTEMYLFVTEPRPDNERVDPANFPELLRNLLADFPAPVLQSIRSQIDETLADHLPPARETADAAAVVQGPRRADRRRRARDHAASRLRRLHRHRGRDRAGRGNRPCGRGVATPAPPSSKGAGSVAGWWSRTRRVWARSRSPAATRKNTVASCASR